MMHEQTIRFDYSARYYTLGNPRDAERVWWVFHGYGQLAQYFIQKFKVLEAHGIAVIAPEGLSRFYLEDVTSRSASGNNRVGATWMTRENRETDIQNYLTYLDAVYDRELSALPAKKLTVLGFSQGAATASRWAMHQSFHLEQLVLWAGIFPPDMDLTAASPRLKESKVVVVSGTADPFITDSKTKEMAEISKRLGIDPIRFQFDGGHELHTPTLEKLI